MKCSVSVSSHVLQLNHIVKKSYIIVLGTTDKLFFSSARSSNVSPRFIPSQGGRHTCRVSFLQRVCPGCVQGGGRDGSDVRLSRWTQRLSVRSDNGAKPLSEQQVGQPQRGLADDWFGAMLVIFALQLHTKYANVEKCFVTARCLSFDFKIDSSKLVIKLFLRGKWGYVGFFFSTVCPKTFHCYQPKKGLLSRLAGTNVPIPSGFPSLLTSFSDVIMGCVCPRARPTLASAAKATRASTVTDGRSRLPAGGSAADTGSVACQRVASPCVTVSQGTPDPPVTKVSLDAVTVCQTSTILRPCLAVFFKAFFVLF